MFVFVYVYVHIDAHTAHLYMESYLLYALHILYGLSKCLKCYYQIIWNNWLVTIYWQHSVCTFRYNVPRHGPINRMNNFKLNNAIPSLYYFPHAEIYLRQMALYSSIYRNEHFDSYLIMDCELEEFDRDLVDSFKSTSIQNSSNHRLCCI